VDEAAGHQRDARVTLHAVEGAPAFLRVRHEQRREFVIERLEGEVGAGVERLAHQALFLMLVIGIG